MPPCLFAICDVVALGAAVQQRAALEAVLYEAARMCNAVRAKLLRHHICMLACYHSAFEKVSCSNCCVVQSMWGTT